MIDERAADELASLTNWEVNLVRLRRFIQFDIGIAIRLDHAGVDQFR